MKEEIKDILSAQAERGGGSVLYDELLSRHSTIAIGGTAAVWYAPSCPEELSEISKSLREHGARVIAIGNGSNTLMPGEGLDAVMVSLAGDYFNHAAYDELGQVTVGAGKKLSSFISDCSSMGLSGMEGLAGIPGTVGGALFVNAGYKSVISDRLLRVKIIDVLGRIRKVEKDDIIFGYREASFDRNAIIIEAAFHLDKAPPGDIRKRMESFFLEKMRVQPLEQKTLGCVFKNPPAGGESGARLIEMAGMKKRRVGGAVVSEKHANFIVNDGGATSGDVKELIRVVRDGVKEKFGVELELEIEILTGEGYVGERFPRPS
ncbi:MAG: UDP-N-acetylmuramate dehydrogenase [Candidatus Omnitrophica bacterium]|nr:UDP-N-acetylmuramate dehydrogenase [Candidatus Omnitrophota bacterium]MBU1128808.1 UDP-N-acetylmuramate dehydrogenase [Candidatus Omnitrophota bacterium]MBU1657253.1 UDP-N-acetylmuramate dehydrogenase [Candidatus Omnitrophota bacterium]MBU1785144.1 UDP-N-acetylmuramate dehydrogenase [Candidatus Omnitrophota bacterium]MBU1851199.1 UDP-N-acetylmuramate dehydrogenase [Candidatus Omnitrophota bacterium]